jgi:DMSO/TMAO reductase YedYZ molybdopterin-dependent catalytic subunit
MKGATARLFAGLALAAAALLAAGCSNLIPPSATPIQPAASQQTAAPTATVLPAVEIRDYKGKHLDSIAGGRTEAINGTQHVNASTYRLGVTGLVKTPLSLTYAQVTSMPAYQQVTTLNCVEGWSDTYLWQGVRVKDLLARAGYAPTATVIIFRCADGYTTSLSLDYVVGNNILLAYKMNGVTIPPERGFPFQVVAEDKFGYKWAKWVTDIQVSNDTTFRGYWESRGYDNSATIPGK